MDEGGQRRRRIVTAVVAAIAVVLVTSAGAWAWYVDRQIGQVERIDLGLGSPERRTGDPARTDAGSGTDTAEGTDEEDGADELTAAGEDAEGEPVTVLIAGVDAGSGPSIAESMRDGEWEPGSYRSDTIMVAHVSADRQKAYLISIPRDAWVRVPGHGRNKINAAFAIGGPRLYLDTVEQLSGLEMDHVAILDWNGFRDLTTAIGGVEVYIPEAVDDVSQGVRWEKGRHVLEGDRALKYVRQRHGLPSGDLDRINRQQNFVRAAMRKMLSTGTVSNPVKVTNVLEAVTQNLTVDDTFTDERIRELALSLRGLDGEDVRFLTVPTRGLGKVGGQSVVRLDLTRTREMFLAMERRELGVFLADNDVPRLPDARSVS